MRRSDEGYVARFWHFFDERQIDKHLLSIGIFSGTVKVMEWAMTYAAAHADKSGLEVGAIIAAVTAPYSALQAAAIRFYFNRDKDEH
jgi:hypothetical protein